jgi:hypothetical protein
MVEMDSIPKRKENGVPHFTEDNLQRIIINPFYAITVAPQLTVEHEPPMGEAEWVRANASLMKEMGTERWLRHLLDVLEGKVGAPDEPVNPSRAVNIDPVFAVAHPPLIGRDMWVDVNVKHIVPKSLGYYDTGFMELPASLAKPGSSLMSDHTLEYCSSFRHRGSALRVSEN